MLLVQLTIGGVVRYLSDEMLALEHAYKPWVESLSAPSWQMDTEYGGMVKFGFGDITISPGFFKEISVWPPPVQAEITVLYTTSTEAAATTLFTSNAHLVSYGSDSVQYDIRDYEYLQKLLDEGKDYDGNDVTFPRAFGKVMHVTPIRISNEPVNGYYRYRLGGIQTSGTAKEIIGFTSYGGGASTKIITASAHGFSNGNTVFIGGSTTFNTVGDYALGHVISAVAATSFVIPVAFVNQELPINAQVWKSGSVAVFEEGVAIASNVVVDPADPDTFYLTDKVEGSNITVCGTGLDTTVSEIAEWCQLKLKETHPSLATYTSTYARNPSPEVSRWETSQQSVTDFLSGLCASFTHLFYIKDSALVLVDMFLSNGNRSLTEYRFFKGPSYQKFNPLKKLIAEWIAYSAEPNTMYDDYDGAYGHYIKANELKAEELLYDYGDEMSIEAFHDKVPQVRSALICIRVIYESDKATIALPFGAALPVPGERLTWTDTNVPIPVPGYIRTRDISYDFGSHEVKISGEGLFIRTDRAAYTVNAAITGASTVTIDSLDMTLGQGAVWKYVITDTDGSRTNMRIGIIQAVWDQAAGGNVEMMADHSSPDIGTTIGIVSFSMDKAATVVRLRATSTAGNWTVHVVRTILGAS